MTIRKLKDKSEDIDLLAKANKTTRKTNEVNKTLAGMFNTGKGRSIKVLQILS